ncbi:2-oxoglutarate-Fe(II) type oxidoreductase-like isoform X2 [Durio zibethinus]|uniref:2-oxoglutarate-Fe(II) type oxidoreductase-like isoform X2 n=1 Tax=Durio zibethinus TaxID=66656 RepID=A0A6P5WTI1_DURZI|nr:2-oxoglutarate-Fe(II) type oxidoreductase-like isoform X2 [Durio zibethinus]
MSEALHLPIIDLSSPDRLSIANSIRQACVEHGFFYLVNHGVEEELLKKVFEQCSKFFSLPIAEKMKFSRKNHRGYTALYAEKLDTSSSAKGDSKESFYIGPLADHLNQWPLEDLLLRSAGTKLISLIALALKLDEDFFEKVGALNEPFAFIRLLHYPGDLESSGEDIYGASAHSDYGMITLLVTDGVPGLQVCREKSKQPQIWEDVPSMSGAFIVNIGDMMERWTNCLFRSTLHRVLPPGQERYSVGFFINPNKDCLVECLESCCSESSPPRFPPIRSLDYLEERVRLTYGS